MNRLLVIGEASFDPLPLPDQVEDFEGSAEIYAALAARRCGAQVTMLSPAMLPGDLSQHDLVHVPPKASLNQQFSLVQACRQRGAVQISARTCPEAAVENPQAVRAMMELSDYFFMTDLEAEALFGSPGGSPSAEAAHTEPGQVLFVTPGAQGACIIQGDTPTSIPGVSAPLLEPTGADDAFCGATLAYLLQKQHPIMAARQAVALAAEMAGQVGPAALLSEDPPPQAPLDPRVRVNEGRVR